MTRPQVSIRGLLVSIALLGFAISYVQNFYRMRSAESELARLRDEVGYLQPSDSDQIAAVRIASEEPLTWQTRVRIPKGTPYRVAYSALWPAATRSPNWFAAQPVPAGESIITVRVLKDPRDDRWKITTIVRHADGIARIGTTLPEEIADVFRGTHDVMSSGVGRQTTQRQAGERLRILDEKYFAGESLLLYGDRGPEEDLVGVFAELQPDIGPLGPREPQSDD
jgi:hypothetical protein